MGPLYMEVRLVFAIVLLQFFTMEIARVQEVIRHMTT
jgi:hypothetical protein